VSLISFLVGLIVAFVSAVQLDAVRGDDYCGGFGGIKYGARDGSADAAIIMAGRTGAAYARKWEHETLEELDALRTMGLNPSKWL
jgi:phospholipid/cholesterol/gamma-HCH transport system permease protein